MQAIVTRLVLVASAAAVGYLLLLDRSDAQWLGALTGAAIGAAAILLERLLSRASSRVVFGGTVGLAVGLALALLLRAAVFSHAAGGLAPRVVGVLVALGLAYLGATVGARHASSLEWPVLAPGVRRTRIGGTPKIMDTSVIIDGRIVDVVAAGFMEGPIIVPQFILRELQQVADSSDSLKRNRGRKGLDVLKAIQDSDRALVEITDRDFPEVREVDGKLLALAEALGARVLTNDYNLNKVAQLRGVAVLNVNDLANAMKPVVLPGEMLTIQVIKEGKERNQGVGYLDDGTMVVVDNGKRFMGQQVEVMVTSVIQTNAGKMIFCAAEDDTPIEVRRGAVARRADLPTVVPAAPTASHPGHG